MRTPVIVGNWKMYKSPRESALITRELKGLLSDAKGVEIAVCPPHTSLETVGRELTGTTIKLGAQNLYPMAEGAYTGEISPIMLRELGCAYCILGHSERRQYFMESDAFVNQKIKAALEFNLTPILCVGENLQEREIKRTYDKISYQIDGAFWNIEGGDAIRVVIAYEPVWAIGTGRTATPEQAQEVHFFIRRKLAIHYSSEIANSIRILYGGSVKPDNVDGLMAKPDIDGALVGGASLKAEDFARIVKFNPQT